MERGFYGFPASEMPAKDIEAHGDAINDLERIVYMLLEENKPAIPRASPGSKTFIDFFIENKRNYFQQVLGNIIETKNSFYVLLKNVSNDIEKMAEEIMVRTQDRRNLLQAQLLEIHNSQMSKWNRQLALCEKILKHLEVFDSSSSFQDAADLDEVLQSCVQEELDFVHAGELKLDTANYHRILETIDNLGKISNVNHCKQPLFVRTVPKFMIGSSGDKEGQFCRPWGVCTDNTGRILVCDRSNHRVQIFSESGEFLISFGKEGSRPGEFNRPCGLAVDKKCRIVVADKDNHRIQVFTYSGHFIHSFGKIGTQLGQFMYPWDVDVNSNCNIAVSDSKNHRVQLFTEKGGFLTWFDSKKCGIESSRAGLRFLDSPRGLAFRPDGSLLVTDFNNHRILLIHRNFNKARVFGSEGHGLGQFFRPQGIACDKNGRFAVADCKNYRIQMFSASEKLVKTFGGQGDAPGQFDCPQGICFHPNRNLIVVDFNNSRVQVF